jgi:hypothetical protein
VHLDLDLAVALADLAAPALDVEGEAPGLVAAVAALLRGVRPMGDWSTAMILSSWSSPLTPRWAPARLRARWSWLATAL